MNRKTIWTATALVAASLVAALPAAQAQGTEGNCNNYGVQVNTYIGSDPDCSSQSNVQHCHQGTGAGAAAGAGSGTGGGNTGEAEASAGTRCTQNNGGNQTGAEHDPVDAVADGCTDTLADDELASVAIETDATTGERAEESEESTGSESVTESTPLEMAVLVLGSPVTLI